MIPSSHAIVTLKPARQAALQAIMFVEDARFRGARLPSMPHVRTFLRMLTGCSRINSAVARSIPGLHRDPKDRLNNLKQVEEALDTLIASQGECCPLPLTTDVQAELFPEVIHTRTDRRMQRENIAFTRRVRREGKEIAHTWLLRQNLLGWLSRSLTFSHRRPLTPGTASGLTSLTRGIWSLPSGTGDRGLPRWSPWTGCGMPGSRCMVSCMKSASL